MGCNLGTGKITQSFATGTITQDLRPTGGQLPAGIANNNEGSIGRDVYWDTQTTGATVGAAQGNAVPAAQGLTSAQMGSTASFGPTWDFGANGVWAMLPARRIPCCAGNWRNERAPRSIPSAQEGRGRAPALLPWPCQCLRHAGAAIHARGRPYMLVPICCDRTDVRC